jgi:hypothetical protein
LSEEEFNTRVLKKIKVFLVKVEKIKAISELDALEMGFAAIILKDRDVEINVPIPKLYRVVINNPVYRAKWRTAVKEELKALIINSTWKEEVLLKGTNLVLTK